MIPETRREEILNLLATNKYMSVKQLASSIYVSEPTIRRDLMYLEKEGSIKRERGGASYVDPSFVKWPFVFRNKSNLKEKLYIGQLASTLVNDGDNIFIDSSSTGLCFAKSLHQKQNLNVLTYGFQTAQTLSENESTSIECVCGAFHAPHSSIYGKEACDFVSRHYAQSCFISCCGLDTLLGLTDNSREEVALKRTFHEHSKQTVLLLDHTKMNTIFYYQDLKLSEIDIIVTDQPLPKNLDEACYTHDIQVIYE